MTDYGQTFNSTEIIDRIIKLVDARDSGVDWTDDDAAELDMLQDFADEASECIADWEYGETFIHEDYFEEYAQQLAEDYGMVDPDAGWPNNHIDWEAAADELRFDYTTFTFDGQKYYAR